MCTIRATLNKYDSYKPARQEFLNRKPLYTWQLQKNSRRLFALCSAWCFLFSSLVVTAMSKLEFIAITDLFQRFSRRNSWNSLEHWRVCTKNVSCPRWCCTFLFVVYCASYIKLEKKKSQILFECSRCAFCVCVCVWSNQNLYSVPKKRCLWLFSKRKGPIFAFERQCFDRKRRIKELLLLANCVTRDNRTVCTLWLCVQNCKVKIFAVNTKCWLTIQLPEQAFKYCASLPNILLGSRVVRKKKTGHPGPSPAPHKSEKIVCLCNFLCCVCIVYIKRTKINCFCEWFLAKLCIVIAQLNCDN